MPVQNIKKTGDRPAVNKPATKMDTLHKTWTVMKPFVHFSIKAMRVIGYALIFIVKSIPKPGDHDEKPKNGKVV